MSAHRKEGINSGCIGIVGTGFVADLYMRSLKTFPDLRIGSAYDINQARLGAFCTYWNISAARSLEQLLDEGPETPKLILKSTNPNAHFEVSRACLVAGKHVYSEKPLATNMDDARALCALAESKGTHACLRALQCAWRSSSNALAGAASE